MADSRTCRIPWLAWAVVMLGFATVAHAEQKKLRIDQTNERFTVSLGDKLFTALDTIKYARPILYPVYGPGQVPMTRNFPMKPDVDGEADDHPHHKSIWCGHGDINGVSFWHEQGKIQVDRGKPIHVKVSADGKHALITFHANYLAPNGDTVCNDHTKLGFHQLADEAMAIDWDTTIHASHGDLTFGDTKEGMMAIRTHPSLRLTNDPDRGVTSANGKAVNSEGVRGGDVWGKKAAWVDYSGSVDGNHVGVAIFDHPANLRHPTTWHARTYGLVAANPFGLSHFEGKPRGAGNLEVKDGQSFRFRYRFVFHKGNADDAKIAKLYRDYSR